MIKIDIDGKPRHPGFDEMAELAIAKGFTGVSAGWFNRPTPHGQANATNTKTGLSLHASGKDPVEAIARLKERLECPSCLEHGDQKMNTPHFASPKCESGGYNHCSCDTCF